MSRLPRLLFLLLVCALAPVLFAQADLVLNSLGTLPQLPPGQQFLLNASFNNYGPSAAADVKLTVTVPPGFEYEGVSAPSPFSCTEPPKDGQGNLVCTASSIGANLYGQIQATLRVDPAAVPGTVITMSATLTSSNAVKPSQTVSGSTTVVQPQNVSLTMSTPASIIPGATYPTTITVTNPGPAAALETTVTFYRPSSGQVFESGMTAPAGWQCFANGPYTYSCRIASFAPGTATFTVVSTVPTDTTLTSVPEKAQVNSFSDADFSDNTASVSIPIVEAPPATLKVTVTASPDPVSTGDLLTYTAKIVNTSANEAQNIKVAFALPGQFAGSTCGSVAGFPCTIDTLAGGHTSTVSFNTIVTAPAGTQLTETTTVTARNVVYDPQLDSATLTVTVAPLPQVDLRPVVTGPASIRAGDEGVWSFKIVNNGPDAATNWKLSFSVPANTSFQGNWQSSGPGFCDSIPTNTINEPVKCYGGALPPGGTFEQTMHLVVSSGASGSIHAAATVSSTNPDPHPENNSASADTPVSVSADAAVMVGTPIPSNVNLGAVVNYTLSVINAGKAPASNVKVQFNLPPSLALISASSPECTGNPAITCAAGTLNPSAEMLFTVIVRAVAAGSITTTATVSTTTADPNSANDSSSTTILVNPGTLPHADLGATILAAPVRAGTTGTWTYRVSNAGPDSATDWQLSFVLPQNTKLVKGTIASGTCTGLTPGAANSQVTCHGTSLPANANVDLSLDLAVSPGATAPIHSSAAVSTANLDANPQNDTATADTTVLPSADLSMEISSDKTTAAVNESVRQAFKVTNNGPDTATGVVLDVTLPPGSKLSGVDFVFGSCSGTAPIHCTAAPIAAGATVTALISFQAPAQAGSFESSAQLTWDDSATGIGVKTALWPLRVATPSSASDVSIAVDAAPNALNAGDAVTYTLGAMNVGGSAASNVTVQLTLPPSLTLLSSSPQCSGNSVVTCTAGTLAAGMSATFTVTARTAVTGSITATATVSTTSVDANTANNSDSATIVVNAAPAPTRRRAAHH